MEKIKGICATGDREGGKAFFHDVLLVKFMHLVLSRIPGESYLGNTGHCWCASCYSCDICQAALLPFLVLGALGVVLFQNSQQPVANSEAFQE